MHAIFCLGPPPTVEGSTVQGSTVQGSTVQGSTVQGSTVQWPIPVLGIVISILVIVVVSVVSYCVCRRKALMSHHYETTSPIYDFIEDSPGYDRLKFHGCNTTIPAHNQMRNFQEHYIEILPSEGICMQPLVNDYTNSHQASGATEVATADRNVAGIDDPYLQGRSSSGCDVDQHETSADAMNSAHGMQEEYDESLAALPEVQNPDEYIHM